jgi:endonuclease-3
MPGKIALPAIIDRLSEMYVPEPPLTDPFLHILWDNIGYLIDDDRRRTLFEEFRQNIGFDAGAILRASEERLLAVARKGGMNPEARVARWREVAQIVAQDCKGDLGGFLQCLPTVKARSFLKRFPVIGDSGADRVLLFCRLDVRPSVDSNGLRVLVRLGLVPQAASYAVTYKIAVETIARFAAQGREWLTSCHMLLREHGRTLCRRNNPGCIACPLDNVCAHAPAKGL